jgi:tetratricopeptide (TPR) repeat protein
MFVRALLALDGGQMQDAVKAMEDFAAQLPDPIVHNGYPAGQCWVAHAYTAAGMHAQAEKALNDGGTFVDCYRFRGDLLEAQGKWEAAQQAYAAAVALAPDLPAAYYSWGMALGRHGDHAGAESKFRDATRRGPHWADPLKAWGDVLVQKGDSKLALAKYDEALTYAPNWAALKSARATAAASVPHP